MLDTIIAGDTLDFDTTVVDAEGNQYTPTDGWAMSLRIVPRTSGTPYSVAATSAANGVDFNVAAAAASTATWSAGNYSAFAQISKSGERKTVYLGEVIIKADPGVATSYDVRTDAKVTLDALKSAYKAYTTNAQGHVAEYEIAGRRMKFRSAEDILEQIRYWGRIVADEEVAARLAAGLSSGRKVYTRFTQ